MSAQEQSAVAAPPPVPPHKKKYPVNYESLDYEEILNAAAIQRNFDKTQEPKKFYGYSGATLIKMLVNVAVGVAVGLAAVFIEWTIGHVVRARMSMTQTLLIDSGVVAAFFFFLAVAIVLVCASCSLVVFYEPCAAGAGIAEVKAYLNGTHIPNLLRLRTLVVKMVGVVGAVGGGLTVGPEGPLVHTAACIASGMTRGAKVFRGCGKNIFTLECVAITKFHNDIDRRDFISAGAAAGLAAAFGSPIGGVLFALEEAASFWSARLTWRSLITCTLACFTVAVFKPPVGTLSASGLLVFPDFTANPSIWELFPFAGLGVIGGLVGALFNFLYTQTFRLRQKVKSRKVVEAGVIAAITAVCVFFVPFLVYECRITPQEWQGDEEEAQYGVQFLCPAGQYNDMATLLMSVREHSIKTLMAESYRFSNQTLVVLALLLFLLMVLTFGTAVPSGLFMPTIFIGSIYGGLVGNLMQQLHPSVAPGPYALLGAVSFLGGTLRSSIALCVIILEGTGNVHYLLPIILTTAVSKFVGDRINLALYETQLVVKKVPFLENESHWQMVVVPVNAVMTPDPVCLRSICTVDSVVKALTSTAHNGFPVVTAEANPALVGIILRWQLRKLLKQGNFMPDAGNAQATERESEASAQYHRSKEFRVELGISDASVLGQYMDLTPHMNAGPFTVQATVPLSRAFRLFRTMGLRHLCVVDERNTCVGMLTRKDFPSHAHELEEYINARRPAPAVELKSSSGHGGYSELNDANVP